MARNNLIGKIVLGYRIEEELGSGASSTVYRVVKRNASGSQTRALKHIAIPTEKQYRAVWASMGGDTSKADNYFTQMLNNIVSEIKNLRALCDQGGPHILRYYDNDIHETTSPKRYDIFILMEYLTPLDEYVQNHDFLIRDVIQLGLDVLEGLRFCHARNIVHRDIKEENIFVAVSPTDNSKTYKIGDFGVSKALDGSTRAESLKGTPDFLAPEVYLRKEGYTKNVDLYSLGIVLYRLLNHTRNPFLPPFPEQYSDLDKETAFHQRMKGEIPPPPALGGDAIGAVILKALSNSSQRFQDADSFIDALIAAVRNTPEDVLSQRITPKSEPVMQADPHKNDSLTIGEEVPLPSQTFSDDRKSKTIHKQLFEDPIPPVRPPDIDPTPRPTPQPIQTHTDPGSDSPSSFHAAKRAVKRTPPPIDDPEDVPILDQHIHKKLIFAIPILFLLVGVIAYFIVVPALYGRVVSFIDWLFSDPQNIIDTLRDPDTAFSRWNVMVGIRIFWWVWLAGFITSLFFVGKQLHAKPQANSPNAIFRGKEAYHAMLDVQDGLKQLRSRYPNKQLDELLYLVKTLEEKLSIEQDFGCGDDATTRCENNIAKQIEYLLDTLSAIEEQNLDECINAMHIAAEHISALLRRRTILTTK